MRSDRGIPIDDHPQPAALVDGTAVDGALEGRVLFFTDNGHGLGHLTRLMAIARRLPPSFAPLFLTLSESYGLVRDLGFAAEYFPSARRLRCGRPAWDHLFLERMSDLLTTLRPSAVVIDHVNPPITLPQLRARHPNVVLVWSRRGLWRDDRAIRALDLHRTFDLVIEPMDIASPVDTGPTVRFRDACYVDPITLLDVGELTERSAARRALGLPEDGETVLLQLSADGPAALHELIGRARDSIREVADVALFAPLHPLHAHGMEAVEGVYMRPVYPVSRHLHAFDAAISTAGYNSFHELMMGAVPTLFVARETDSLDHQELRAEVARIAGAALHTPRLDPAEARSAVEQLLDPAIRRRMREAAMVLYPGNGAFAAAQAVIEAIQARTVLGGAATAS